MYRVTQIERLKDKVLSLEKHLKVADELKVGHAQFQGWRSFKGGALSWVTLFQGWRTFKGGALSRVVHFLCVAQFP